MKIVSKYPDWITFMGMSDYNDHLRGKRNVTPPLVVVVLQEFGHFGINGALAWSMIMNLTSNMTRHISNPGRFKGVDGKVAEYDDARLGVRALAQWTAIQIGHAEIKRLKPEHFVVTSHFALAKEVKSAVVEVEDLVFDSDPGFGVNVAETYRNMLAWVEAKKGGTPAHDPLPPRPEPEPEKPPAKKPVEPEPTPAPDFPLPPAPPVPTPPAKPIFKGIGGALAKRAIILAVGWAIGAASAALPGWAGPILDVLKKLIVGALG